LNHDGFTTAEAVQIPLSSELVAHVSTDVSPSSFISFNWAKRASVSMLYKVDFTWNTTRTLIWGAALPDTVDASLASAAE
jgi:hypothetical protein